ncbi:hypothetical protein M3Y94_00465500 [Aphelenchoides besseyi]|nr:hypothetical protein M3Y94_00465500 [Aphelenchoides besseyi]KAI6229172.1 hypothetical protein M3Y95_00503300 [Aphelenchoides besseyi]
MESTFVTTMGMEGFSEDPNSDANITTPASEADRIPMPCLVADLLDMASTDEKITYGSYTFPRIRVVGKIVNITEAENKELHYEITDPDDESVAGRTVHGTIYLQARKGTFSKGDWMAAFATMRSFDGVLHLLTFAVRPVEMSEVEMYKAQARCARFYYKDNAPEKILNGVVPEYIGTPLTNEPMGDQSRNEPTNTQQFGASIPASFPNRSHLTPINIARAPQQEPKVNNSKATRDRIHNYFKEHQSSRPTDGFHMEDIKRELGNPPDFENEIFYLVNEGVLFNTNDSNHFTML